MRQSTHTVVSPHMMFSSLVWAGVTTASVQFPEALPDGAAITAKFDHRGRLHCAVGPAVEVSTGEQQWHWHGVLVPEFVVMDPSRITVEMIETVPNAEVRRVLIERYGQARYMQDCGAKLVHKDETGELYRKKFHNDREPLCMVKVKNSTPEPDGSFKDYWLRVPPTTKTAKEGVAWTFGMHEKDYQPALET